MKILIFLTTIFSLSACNINKTENNIGEYAIVQMFTTDPTLHMSLNTEIHIYFGNDSVLNFSELTLSKPTNMVDALNYLEQFGYKLISSETTMVIDMDFHRTQCICRK